MATKSEETGDHSRDTNMLRKTFIFSKRLFCGAGSYNAFLMTLKMILLQTKLKDFTPSRVILTTLTFYVREKPLKILNAGI